MTVCPCGDYIVALVGHHVGILPGCFEDRAQMYCDAEQAFSNPRLPLGETHLWLPRASSGIAADLV